MIFSRNAPKWANRFLDMADLVASWSKDPSTRIGAVIVNDRRRVLGVGYNGFPDRLHDSPERLNDRPAKYARTIHAEVNAVLNAAGPVHEAALFITAAPCSDCAKYVIQAGIGEVHFRVSGDNADLDERWAKQMAVAIDMFDEARLPVIAWGASNGVPVVGRILPEPA